MIIWTGQLLSRIGSGISAFALGVLVLEKTGSTTAFSLLLLAAFLPPVLLIPVGGVIADRRDRRLLMIIGDMGSALGMLIIIGALVFRPDILWPLYAGVSLSAVFTALHAPAFKASVTDLLDESQYARAGGLIQMAEASRYLVAPAVAALLIARINLPLLMILDMLTFIIAAMSVLFVRKRFFIQAGPLSPEKRESFISDFMVGIRYIRGNRILLRLLTVTTIITFLTGVLQVLYTPIVMSISDAATLGTVQSLAASGMLISSLFIGLLSKTDRQKRVISLALAAAGLFYFMIGFNTTVVGITIATFGFFFTLPLINTSLEVLFRQNIEKEKQGRVWSLVSLITQIGMLSALSITGILADRVFNPLLTSDGPLSEQFGEIIGTGPVRGSGLMVMISGLCIVILGLLLAKRGITLKGCGTSYPIDYAYRN